MRDSATDDPAICLVFENAVLHGTRPSVPAAEAGPDTAAPADARTATGDRTESRPAAKPEPDPEPDPAPAPLRVGWFLGANDVRSASTRYRCHHFARVLAERAIESVYFTDPEQMADAMYGLDAAIVVKRLDAAVLKVAAAAHMADRPLYLDLCDDLLSDRYAKNRGGVHRIHFAALVPALAGVTCPSAAMADRIRSHAAALNLPELPVHVIPDIAETRELAREAERFVAGAAAPAPDPGAGRDRATGRKRVLWFGNYGAKHSNFGIFSLLPALPALAEVHREIPLELVVVSNHQGLFEALTADCGFPARYVPWSAEAVYDELDRADVALLTGGDDDFCTIKSSNRALQALAAGVPVISSPSPALAEFADAVVFGKYDANLRRYLSADRATLARDLLQPAERVLARYTPERLAGLWERLLRTAVGAASRRREARNDGTVLFLVQSGETAADLQAPLLAAVEAGLRCEVMMALDTVGADPRFRGLLQQARLLPRFFEKPSNVYPGALEGAAALVVGDPEAPAARNMRSWAEARGCPVLTWNDLPADWTAKLTRPPAGAAPEAAAQPGPYPERAAADGSAEWVFVVHRNARGWILDAICREIGSRQPASWRVSYYPDPPPEGRIYFFSHFSLYQNYLRMFPERMRAARSLIWYTHPREETEAGIDALLTAFGLAGRVIFTCAANRDLWLSRGLDPDRAAVVLGGADPGLFRGHERGGGAIGLSSSFYERKNPDALLELIRRLPHRRFELLGRNWNQYALFEEMKAAPNFTYRTAPYRDYPEIYAGWDVFLSMSTLEGGPIPLLEAMMENAVPVASRTGFAPDLIRHGENGFIFDTDAPAAAIAPLIETAFGLRTDIRSTVRDYDWDSFARRIVDLAQ